MQVLLLNGVTPFKVSAELVQPIVDTISSGLATLTPIGISIMATFIGLGLVKRVIYKFL